MGTISRRARLNGRMDPASIVAWDDLATRSATQSLQNGQGGAAGKEGYGAVGPASVGAARVLAADGVDPPVVVLLLRRRGKSGNVDGNREVDRRFGAAQHIPHAAIAPPAPADDAVAESWIGVEDRIHVGAFAEHQRVAGAVTDIGDAVAAVAVKQAVL